MVSCTIGGSVVRGIEGEGAGDESLGGDGVATGDCSLIGVAKGRDEDNDCLEANACGLDSLVWTGEVTAGSGVPEGREIDCREIAEPDPGLFKLMLVGLEGLDDDGPDAYNRLGRSGWRIVVQRTGNWTIATFLDLTNTP